jgi:hypothetical protein
LGAAVLWPLCSSRSAKICTPRYVELVAMTPQIKSSMVRSPFFWIPLAFLGLMLAAAVVTAYAAAQMR